LTSNDKFPKLNSRERKAIALVLSLLVLPLLIVVAFSASLNITTSSGPLFNLSEGAAGELNNNRTVVVTTTIDSTLYVNTVSSAHQRNLGQQVVNSSITGISPSYLIAILSALFLVVALGIVLNFRRSNRTTAAFYSEDGEEDEEERKKRRAQVSQALDEAISKLKEGGEYRKTVLECYRKIVAILEKRAKVKSTLLTAREFEDAASKSLGLKDDPDLARVTNLFEVARYSTHDITSAEAESAIDCLSNLRKVLSVKPEDEEERPDYKARSQ
jgi:Domain of unknown function (DUF4129)